MSGEETPSARESEKSGVETRYPHLTTSTFDAQGAADSFFSRQSMIRRMSREALGLLGGGRAILLQLAHPLVAAGVGDHSTFQTDPLARLFGTLELMHALVFADRERARQALKRFHTGHVRIRGCLPQRTGRYPAGTPYIGSDPTLKLWVYATLIDTSLVAYQRFVAPLSADQRRSFYADARVLARLLGIPDAILPATLDGFKAYVTTMLTGGTLAVSPTARRLAWEVFDPDVGPVQYASARLLRFVTAGLLPQRFRSAYGLSWGRRQQILLDSLSRTTRLLRPMAPAWLWKSPLLEGGKFPRALLWPGR